MNFPLQIDRLKDMSITVVGMGISGLAAAELLHKSGAEVFVTEFGERSKFIDAIKFLDDLKIPYETDGHTEALKKKADFIVISPGIAPETEILKNFRANKLDMVAEVEVASWFFDGICIAISGSNGKTTVVQWITHILKSAGINAVAAGNVGYPFSNAVMSETPFTHVVLELSSYQLHSIASLKPEVAALLNVSADHLQWHGGFENYFNDKIRISEYQSKNDFLVLPGWDQILIQATTTAKSKVLKVGLNENPENTVQVVDEIIWLSVDSKWERIAAVRELPIPGRHNVENALFTITACSRVGLSIAQIRRGLLSFKGVPHRLEMVANDGRQWISDSKSTNVDSLRVALEATERPIWLIAGGRDKGAPFKPVENLVQEKVERILTIGEAASRIDAELNHCTGIIHCENLQTAVGYAHANAPEKTAILLSPGCASFDQFSSFFERGEIFKTLVKQAVRS
ncbi:UDP-N-acetylmuramoyl-L-alanine--D-glutamate ligase [bacterium]|nr:UDP-N-acetylmuramoyl-L-alanine--D-glutamate ligase [bacterium]